jgi:hypothetical protein
VRVLFEPMKDEEPNIQIPALIAGPGERYIA